VDRPGEVHGVSELEQKAGAPTCGRLEAEMMKRSRTEYESKSGEHSISLELPQNII